MEDRGALGNIAARSSYLPVGRRGSLCQRVNHFAARFEVAVQVGLRAKLTDLCRLNAGML